MMNKISIILPIYNAEKYLEDCIKSVLNQTHKNLEIILVNDGSTDNSKEICEKYKRLDNRIKVINVENGGASKARNEGLKIATGKYIMFLDADDFFEPTACEVLYNKIEKEDAEFVVGNYRYVDHDGTPWSKVVFDQAKYKNFKLSIKDYNKSFYVMNSAVWNKIYRKSFIDELQLTFVDDVPAEDAIFVTYCFLHSKSVYYIQDVVCNYRQRNDHSSFSNNCSKKYFEGINKSYKIIYENFKKNNQIAYYRYFYAKSMSYILYKFIDSDIMTDEEKIEMMKKMKWFYALSKDIEVPIYQKSLVLIIEAILKRKYKTALTYCDILKEVRVYIPKEQKEKLSKPDLEMYKEISTLDEKYEN